MKHNNGPSIYNIGSSTTSTGSTGSTVMKMVMNGNNNNNLGTTTTTTTTANSGIQYLIILILLFPIVSFITVNTYSSTILLDPIDIATKANGGKGKVSSIDNDLFSQFTKRSDKTGSKIQQEKQQSTSSTSSTTSTTSTTTNKIGSTLAGLSCTEHGGPSDEVAAEMVYWQDIPSDAIYKSQLKHPTIEQYITFEPDHGGWNNIRMAMETVVGMAFAMGRTLVLPPELEFYLLGSKEHAGHGQQQSTTFTFSHFFHMESIQEEHKYGTGVRIISMTEYLQTVGVSGQLKDKITGTVSYPPQNNRTNWDGEKNVHILYEWLRSVSYLPLDWDPGSCLAVFPETRSIDEIKEIQTIRNQIINSGQPLPKYEDYIDKPVPINASTIDRMKESWAGRNDICIYNTTMQNEQYIHFLVDSNSKSESRLLTHFYTFLFFTSYINDLWMKRFIRDHVRYMDEIQCAAARVIGKVRERAIRRDPIHNPTGIYDAIHVRRGDFQYKATRIDNIQLLDIIQRQIPVGSSVFIATDERDKTYFRPLMDQYHIMFLDEFISTELSTMNSNYFGMIDALITTKSRTFYGCWFSTFTGYINRIRGYHHDKAKLPGYEMGLINSYYYAVADRYDHMRHYYPIKQQFYAREFPAAWRLIDTTVPDQ